MPQPAPETGPDTAEHARLREEAAREKNWKRWGPYLAERQWGTVREDYSADGDCWNFFPHDHARSRAYRWGEDGLLGFCDRQCRLCLSVALWNGKDTILKERLFGLTGPEGNHAEDVKEQYWYLDSTPTHSYARAAYRYPQAAFPYDELVAENARRTKQDLEYELADTGVFDDDRYFDVVAEYAKADDNDVLMRVSVTNHGPEAASLHVLPTLWFRNTWVWGCEHEGCSMRPDLRIDPQTPSVVRTDHETLGRFTWTAGEHPDTDTPPDLWFTENLTNTETLFGTPSLGRYTKDAFDRRLVRGQADATNPRAFGTKAAAVYELILQPCETKTLRTRLFQTPEGATSSPSELVKPDAFDAVFTDRLAEADAFYDVVIPGHVPDDQRNVSRQAYAGLLWTKQFYHYIIEAWLGGDPKTPPPPEDRKDGRNHDWPHLFARDILSMPDKWEYPWFAAWDTAFHMIPFCRVDPQFAKDQLELFLREWYLHPNGQIPAYEFAFGDVNPPVHAWAVWRVYKMTAPRGRRDRRFLASCFQKLLLNFTWWVNRKDPSGNHLFAGGFLGLDNIGVFDRSRPLPGGQNLIQADATAWMAFYCNTMLSMALELADTDRDVPEARAYADMASKFFEHFVAIADAINGLGGDGLWDEGDGIYYDQLQQPDGKESTPLKVRSLVGLMPLIAAEVFPRPRIDRLPGFRKRMDWFLKNRPELAGRIAFMDADCDDEPDREDLLLLALPSRDRLRRVIEYLLDEDEFLGPYGVRSVSKHHEGHPFTLHLDGQAMSVAYTPGESDTHMFGGNSNWRGPVWFPINYLLVEALQRYHHFYGDTFTVECPTGSGNHVTLDVAAREIERRLIRLCPADDAGRVLFYEYFHGDTGRGLGASHQTGWTALVARCIEDLPAGG
ncbi:MAG: glucosidase [Planctomycetota bacterium]